MANPHNPVTIVTGGGNLVTAVTDGGNPVTAVTGGGNLVTLTTSGMNPVTFVGELYPQDNAASVITEVNATTGWAAGGAAVLSADGTPDQGSYAIRIVASAASDSIYFDLSTILSEGVAYRLTSRLRHDGAGNATGKMRYGLGDTITTAGNPIILDVLKADTTYQDANLTFTYAVASTRYLVLKEQHPNNDGGAYLDAISISTI